MSTILDGRKRSNVLTFAQKKHQREPITVMTAYDFPTARLVDQAGIDAILVGDSLGMVVLGYPNTLPVTMEEMLHHCRAVARGASNAMLIGDMPFMSYQVSTSEALRNAGRFLQEAGMDAIKLEGGQERSEAIRAIVQAGIPVMGHIGLTPQSIHQFGSFKPQAKQAAAAKKLCQDALALQDAGCFSIVLESIPTRLAEFVSKSLLIPTIGIGAGAECDGQVLVLHDMLGIFEGFKPKFAKQYANLQNSILKALETYRQEVETRQFPQPIHTVDMTEDEWQKFLKLIE